MVAVAVAAALPLHIAVVCLPPLRAPLGNGPSSAMDLGIDCGLSTLGYLVVPGPEVRSGPDSEGHTALRADLVLPRAARGVRGACSSEPLPLVRPHPSASIL